MYNVKVSLYLFSFYFILFCYILFYLVLFWRNQFYHFWKLFSVNKESRPRLLVWPPQ